MTILTFDSYDHFLEKLDGQVHAIANWDNTQYVCDVLETELIELLEAGLIQTAHVDRTVEGNAADFIITIGTPITEVKKFEVEIDYPINFEA